MTVVVRQGRYPRAAVRGCFLTGTQQKDGIVVTKSVLVALAFVFSVPVLLSACGPAQTNLANPTVPGDNSTISGDQTATRLRQTQ